MPYKYSECSDQPVDSEGTNQAELMSRLSGSAHSAKIVSHEETRVLRRPALVSTCTAPPSVLS